MKTTNPPTHLFDVLYQDVHHVVIQTHRADAGCTADALYGIGNVALHVQDDPHKVLTQRAKLLHALADYGVDEIHWLNQVHGNQVCDTSYIHALPTNADALIGERAGGALAIMTADCVPIALFAKQGMPQVLPIACIHAGHQGLSNGIIKQTWQQLQTQLGRMGAADVPYVAVIGACISTPNYEIDAGLADRIVSQVSQQQLTSLTDKALYECIILPTSKTDKCHLDVLALAQLELDHLGIEVVAYAKTCSYADPRWYSYRRQVHEGKPATGRMAMLVVRRAQA